MEPQIELKIDVTILVAAPSTPPTYQGVVDIADGTHSAVRAQYAFSCQVAHGHDDDEAPQLVVEQVVPPLEDDDDGSGAYVLATAIGKAIDALRDRNAQRCRFIEDEAMERLRQAVADGRAMPGTDADVGFTVSMPFVPAGEEAHRAVSALLATSPPGSSLQ